MDKCSKFTQFTLVANETGNKHLYYVRIEHTDYIFSWKISVVSTSKQLVNKETVN